MLISHVYLFTNANEISLQVTMEDLPFGSTFFLSDIFVVN